MDEITTDVSTCARCGFAHYDLRLTPLLNPPPDITHWATCPETGQPILVRVTYDFPTQNK